MFFFLFFLVGFFGSVFLTGCEKLVEGLWEMWCVDFSVYRCKFSSFIVFRVGVIFFGL